MLRSWQVIDLGPDIGTFLIDQKPFMISKPQRLEAFSEGSRPLRWFSRKIYPVDSGTWHHFCVSYDHKITRAVAGLNKKILDDYTFTTLVANISGPTPLMFDPYYVGMKNLNTNWRNILKSNHASIALLISG